MRYVSTRGHADRKRFCEILLEGLAPDGGLYLPVSYPKVDASTLARWRGLSYADLAKNLGTSAAYISKVFRGDTNLPIESMVKLARATGGQLDVRIQAGAVAAPAYSRAVSNEPVSSALWAAESGAAYSSKRQVKAKK